MRAANQDTPRLLIGLREAAESLGLSERTLRRYAKRGDIPSVKLDRALRFSPTALQAWIEQRMGTEA